MNTEGSEWQSVISGAGVNVYGSNVTMIGSFANDVRWLNMQYHTSSTVNAIVDIRSSGVSIFEYDLGIRVAGSDEWSSRNISIPLHLASTNDLTLRVQDSSASAFTYRIQTMVSDVPFNRTGYTQFQSSGTMNALVTSGAASGLYGAFVQAMPTLNFDAKWMIFSTYIHSTGPDYEAIFEIATGAASSEVVRVTDAGYKKLAVTSGRDIMQSICMPVDSDFGNGDRISMRVKDDNVGAIAYDTGVTFCG